MGCHPRKHLAFRANRRYGIRRGLVSPLWRHSRSFYDLPTGWLRRLGGRHSSRQISRPPAFAPAPTARHRFRFQISLPALQPARFRLPRHGRHARELPLLPAPLPRAIPQAERMSGPIPCEKPIGPVMIVHSRSQRGAFHRSRSVPAADQETDSSASEKAPHSFHGYPKAQFLRPPV